MMEASAALSLQSSNLIGFVKSGKKLNGYMQFSPKIVEEKINQKLTFRVLLPGNCSIRSKRVGLEISCCYKNSAASAVESGNSYTSVDEALILQKNAQDVIPYLNDRCIYLVGMMGSGKTTVGKILSEALGYSFFDSDKLVEQAVGATSVAQIFKQHSEEFFRKNETEVLKDLSSMRRLVVATGGGAVIRPINWIYIKQGVTVWLDVPLEALARRIAAVGTDSRPLLHQQVGDAYTKAFMRLTTLSEERGEAYANADARVCLQYIAEKQCHGNVASLTPTAIALEALLKIKEFLVDHDNNRRNH